MAGGWLPPQQLDSMLEQYDRQLDAWKKAKFRRKIKTHSLFPEVSEEDATKLLRISAIQAIHNARAYCRDFDQLSGPQQMALTQLVFQMGVNLEEFTQFLGAINTPPVYSPVAAGSAVYPDPEYWHSVQTTLIQSDWARRYSTRAISVIAMFDPATIPTLTELRRESEPKFTPWFCTPTESVTQPPFTPLVFTRSRPLTAPARAKIPPSY